MYFQTEIESLRGYIDDQQQVITGLQNTGHFSSQSSVDSVIQLQRVVIKIIINK